MSSNLWHGPAKMLGKDGQMCLLKQGGFYLRVHPCRMAPFYGEEVSSSDACDTLDVSDAAKTSSPVMPQISSIDTEPRASIWTVSAECVFSWRSTRVIAHPIFLRLVQR